MYMKLTSSFLFVATGLILCTSLSAQQYHDAAAFGLKGNVKECKVLNTSDGSVINDEHNFCYLGFTNEGKLDQWRTSISDSNRLEDVSEIDRIGVQLKSFLYYDIDEYIFHYRGETLIGYSMSSADYSIILDQFITITEVFMFQDDGKESFSVKSFVVGDASKKLDSVIAKSFNSERDLSQGLEAYCRSHSLGQYRTYINNYIVRERDAHGNYTALYNPDTGITTKRIITYWDDEPASAKPATAKPVQAPKPVVTETAPEKADVAKNVEVTKTVEDFRAATPKELSASDILTRPFGVLPTERWRCSMDQILSDLSRYGWKTKIDNEFSFSYTIELDNILDKSGYDLSVLGVVPFSVTARFREDGKELSSMSYSLSSKNHKEAREFCDRLISYLRSAGVDFPEPSKHASEVSAKYGKSIVRIKFPGKGSTVSFLDINYWSYYWSSDGQWVSGWVE